MELDFASILEGTELDFGCLLKGLFGSDLGRILGGFWESLEG